MRLTLPLVVFSCGAIVMILELAASRIVAPYLGTSIIVWTSLIGVILAALACGNWLGGRLADRYPRPATLAALLLAASALVALSAHFQSVLGPISALYSLQASAVIGVCLLFGPATIVLGTIAPIAVKLSAADIEKMGRLVGNLYALSNAGSIAGTFLGGFFLILFFGSTRIISALAVALALLAFLVFLADRRHMKRFGAGAGIVALALVVPPAGMVFHGGTLLADVDTRYSRTWVVDESIGGYTVRTMRNSVAGYQSGMLVEYPDLPLFDYIQMYDVFEAFAPEAANALMLGGSGYTYPRHFLAQDDERRMTVVEIDPGVTALAREYFHLTDDPRMTIVHEDARTYLNRAHEQHDVIFVDAFNSHHLIPFHLTTREAVHNIARNLSEHGVVLVNVISALEGDDSGFLAAEYATYKEVFPYVNVYQVDISKTGSQYQNLMLIASFDPLVPGKDAPHAAELAQKEWKEPVPAGTVLTDDFAPVERYTKLLFE